MQSLSININPWITALGWNLRATDRGDTHLPFCHHVCKGQIEARPDTKFLSFPLLPTELQLHIISLCEAPTLFQLMSVSRTTREAKKLFWSDPATRYMIDGHWLLAGGHPRYTDGDLEALKCMQHIEVTFDHSLGSIFILEWERGDFRECIPASNTKRIIFWEALRRRFPRVTDVVLVEVGVRNAEQPVPTAAVMFDYHFGSGEFSARCAAHELIMTQLAAMSPDGISVKVSQDRWRRGNCSDCNGGKTRYLWQLEYGNDNSLAWKLITTSWSPRRVMPPPKRFFGTVGAYQRYERNRSDLMALETARQRLAMQATATYYDLQRMPRTCPWKRCDEQIEPTDDFVAHECYTYMVSRSGGKRTSLPPCEMLRAAFASHDATLDLKKRYLRFEMGRMRYKWGEPGSVEHSSTAQSFLQQLREDPFVCE
jgi:hypothetical protein